MEIEWDEEKRRLLIERRRVDIVYAALIFEGHVLTRIDDRADYAEIRKVSLGMVGDECFVVVHTARDSAIRLITAWKGGRRERSDYEAGIARRDPGHEGTR